MNEVGHSINVCFSRTNSLMSKAIRWFTRSDVSHCYITYKDLTLNRVMIMEADWKGFILVPWDTKTLKGRQLVARYTVNVPEKDQLASLHLLTFFLGTGYDFFNLLPMALRRVKKRFNNPFDHTGRLICSESVVRFLNECGATDLPFPHAWTPEDIYSYIQERPDMFKRQE